MNKNLLILGAGQYSYVVKETAEAVGLFDEIGFLDDDEKSAIGKLWEFQKFIDKYNNAFVAIGKNTVRLTYVQQLDKCGFTVQTLIHPSAKVSKSATIGMGSIIEANAVINANAVIGRGCIISAGAVINHNAVVGEGSHIDCNATVASSAELSPMSKIRCGDVVFPAVRLCRTKSMPDEYSFDDGV